MHTVGYNYGNQHLAAGSLSGDVSVQDCGSQNDIATFSEFVRSRSGGAEVRRLNEDGQRWWSSRLSCTVRLSNLPVGTSCRRTDIHAGSDIRYL